MYWLTEDAKLVCEHEAGSVAIDPTQSLVFVDGRRVLVENYPLGRPITKCPLYGPGLKPCMTALKVEEGYSPKIRIDGHPVCLDTVTGLTDGSPFGTFHYTVRRAGQSLVEESV